jgi:hypothetical protein
MLREYLDVEIFRNFSDRSRRVVDTMSWWLCREV